MLEAEYSEYLGLGEGRGKRSMELVGAVGAMGALGSECWAAVLVVGLGAAAAAAAARAGTLAGTLPDQPRLQACHSCCQGEAIRGCLGMGRG